MDKEDVVRIYNGILKQKNEWNNAICSNMDGPGDYHTKWSKSDKDKYRMMWNLKKMIQTTHLQNRNRLTDLENDFMATQARGRGGGAGDRLGVWDWHVHTAIFKTGNQQRPTI